MRDQEVRVGGRADESKERDTSVEEDIMGLTRNLALGKLPGMHKDDPTKNVSNNGEATLNTGILNHV
ncbi:hypothetical protein I79_005420 [Cricetulus griseus]|nr:hypothetical protein I79_005420 [Cricetulus griseus]